MDTRIKLLREWLALWTGCSALHPPPMDPNPRRRKPKVAAPPDVSPPVAGKLRNARSTWAANIRTGTEI